MRRCLFVLALLAACSDSDSIAIEQDEVEIGVPPDECVALVGSEPWITLFEPRLTRPCVIVAEDQDVQIWNKGSDELTIQWVDGQRQLRSDDHLDTGPIASVLVPGPNQIASAPYPMPVIWLLPATTSPSAGTQLDGESFGPAMPGMTLGQASEVLGLSIEIDPNLLPGPACLGAVIVGDPYSPIFVVFVESDQSDSEIVRIVNELNERSCG